MTGSPPDVVHWTPRSGDHGDCAVVVLATATGHTYEEMLTACVAVRPEVLHLGLTVPHVRRVLKLFGYRVRVITKFDLDEDTGLLWVEDGRKCAHLVYLWGGRVVDPLFYDRTALWLDAEAFINAGAWTAKALITFREAA
jgi:hypothetical protein